VCAVIHAGSDTGLHLNFPSTEDIQPAHVALSEERFSGDWFNESVENMGVWAQSGATRL